MGKVIELTNKEKGMVLNEQDMDTVYLALDCVLNHIYWGPHIATEYQTLHECFHELRDRLIAQGTPSF